jgi:4-amino-4-deoxy-L-arabinose transferase-like glycosyltransferase
MAASPPPVTQTRQRHRAAAEDSPDGRHVTTTLMVVVTFAAVALWIFAQVDGERNETDAVTWLLVCALLIAWPCYFGTRAMMKMRGEIRQLQELVQTGSYRDGYADGYLSCAAVLHAESGSPPAGNAN